MLYEPKIVSKAYQFGTGIKRVSFLIDALNLRGVYWHDHFYKFRQLKAPLSLEGMICIEEKIAIDPCIQRLLPLTYEILTKANLTIHPYVDQVLLEGSRGLSNRYRPDSDIDLSLIVDSKMLFQAPNQEDILRTIVETTINNWESPIELDTAAIFDIHNCQLRCLSRKFSSDNICPDKGVDCLGIYKTQRGFNGYVPRIGVRIELLQPWITVWKRSSVK